MHVLIKQNMIVKVSIYLKYALKIYNTIYMISYWFISVIFFLLLHLLYISYFSIEWRKFVVFHKNWLAAKSYHDIAFLPLT